MARTYFPRGQVTLGGSVVVNVDNFGLDLANNVALKGTLADPNGIPVDGMRSTTITFDLMVTNDQADTQAEIAVISAVLAGTSSEPLPVGYKNGSITIQTSVTPSSVKLSDKLGDPATANFTAMGRILDAQGI